MPYLRSVAVGFCKAARTGGTCRGKSVGSGVKSYTGKCPEATGPITHHRHRYPRANLWLCRQLVARHTSAGPDRSHRKPGPAIGQSHARLTKPPHGPFHAGHSQPRHVPPRPSTPQIQKRKTKTGKNGKIKMEKLKNRKKEKRTLT